MSRSRFRQSPFTSAPSTASVLDGLPGRAQRQADDSVGEARLADAGNCDFPRLPKLLFKFAQEQEVVGVLAGDSLAERAN